MSYQLKYPIEIWYIWSSTAVVLKVEGMAAHHVFFDIYYVYFRPLIELKSTYFVAMVAFVADKVDFL